MQKELFSKEKIKSLINDLNPSLEIVNINKFEDEITIDLLIENFTHKSKTEAKNSIINVLSLNFDSKLTFKFNFKPKVTQIKDSSSKLNNVQNIIAISSAKGGVGKSTVTANIAVTLSKMGFKVGVLDADIYGPSMPIMFDLVGRKPLAVDIDGKSKMKPLESYGVKILSIGFFTSIDQAVIWRGPMATKALNQLIFDADWQELDFLLIDLPPGTGDIHLSIIQKLAVNGSIVISTPQIVALADARKGISMYKQENINIPILGLIENMSYFKPPDEKEKKYYIFGKDGVKNLAKDFKIPFIGEVPIFQGIRESGDIGRPGALQEDTELSKMFDNITRNMIINLTERNTNLPPTEIVKIKTMAGCL